MTEWDGVERRRENLVNFADLERHIDARIRAILEEKASAETKFLNARFDALETLLKSAFPDGDPLRHKAYHDEVMEFMKERRELWKAIREKTLSGLLWSMMLTGGAAFWHYLKAKLGAP